MCDFTFNFFFAPLTCTHSIFFVSPLLSFLSLMHPYFHITCTYTFKKQKSKTNIHTFRANKPRREGWLVYKKKQERRKNGYPANHWHKGHARQSDAPAICI